MAATPFPILQDVSIPALGVTLVDSKNVSAAEQTVGRILTREVLQVQVLNAQRPETFLCGTEQSEHENAVFAQAEIRDPGISYTEFLSQVGGAVVRDDSDCDPRLPVVTFTVRVGGPRGRILGTFLLYNIEIEKAVPPRIEFSAMPMPACNPATGFTLRDTWNGIMRHLLENDLSDGRQIIDLVEWRFPTRTSHEWRITPAQLATVGLANTSAEVPGLHVVAGLDGHSQGHAKSGAPSFVRRNGAPPRPARS